MLNKKALAASLSAVAPAGAAYIEDVFSTYLYTGNGTTQTITNGIDLTGEGGMVWIKNRDASGSDHLVSDTERGNNATIRTNKTDSQTVFTNSFGIQHGSSGFTVQGESNVADARNNNGDDYASWTFRKAEKFFDVVTYTGSGSNRTVAHNLGSVPGCIIVKRTDTAGDWQVYHRANTANPETDYLVLNSTAATADSNTRWNDTAPTSTEFTVGTEATVNAFGNTYVAYLFAHDAGGFGDGGTESVIKCGSYTGNASTSGPVIDLGWEPQWVLMKNASSNGSFWTIFDNMRGIVTNGTASDDARLMPHDSSAETLTNALSLTATGFQITNSSADYNGNGDTHIYIAIRRGPMKTPTDATEVFKAVAQTSQSNVTTDFPVDMVIMGDRNSTWGYNWSTQDRLRGKTAVLFTSATTAENTGSLSAFDSNTFFKDGWVSGGVSAIYETFRRAPGFFDVVAYTGDGTTGRLISHNLGVQPELIIVKNRDGAPSVTNWMVSALAADINYGGTNFGFVARLDLTDAFFSNNTYFTINAPTSTGFYVTTNRNNTSVNFIVYLFASCPGVSKVGSYTGTGTTLSVDCGFTAGARFVLIKRADSTGDWYTWDTARGIVSGNDPYLLLNSTSAEVTSTDYIDPLSSGFQISSTAPAAINASGGRYIFLAIA
jgi:hypothetical protein